MKTSNHFFTFFITLKNLKSKSQIIFSPICNHKLTTLPDQLPLQISVKSQRSIHSYLIRREQVNRAEPIPLRVKPLLSSFNLRPCLGHRKMAEDSIRRTLCYGCYTSHSSGCLHSNGTQSAPLFKMAIVIISRFMKLAGPIKLNQTCFTEVMKTYLR